MALVIHPHFHRRKTGVTTHVETVVPALNAEIPCKVLSRGYRFDKAMPTINEAELRQALRAGGPVIWHAHRNHEMLTGIRLRIRYPNIRLVFTRHTSSRPSLPTRLLMAKADACVVLNRESLEYASGDAKIVYHGVDTERFNYCRDDSAVAAAIGKSDGPVIGIVGRVRPEKGHEVLVDALVPLRESYPNLKAVFVGACDRKHRPWLRSLEQKAPGLIEWVGEQGNIASWYQGISIMALPSFREGFSCTVLEAMASGCVVAVSDISDFDQVVDHGNNGFLFEAGNHRALRDILGELLSSPQSITRIGKAASQTILKKFRAQDEARALAGIYRGLL